MKLTVITVGKKHDKQLAGAIAEFEKRLKSPFAFEWQFLPNSNFDGEKARAEESERLLRTISPDDFVILCDERGKNLSSPEFARVLSQKLLEKNVKIVIGGAFGVSPEFRQRADLMWSFWKENKSGVVIAGCRYYNGPRFGSLYISQKQQYYGKQTLTIVALRSQVRGTYSRVRY
jgi:23S rRNA (pseudouridine1915-N3)-methyltransferase